MHGAFISDFETGKHEIINDINPCVKNEILQDILSHRCIPFISSFCENKDSLYYEKVINDGMNWYLKDRIKNQDKRLKKASLQHVLKENIICYTIIDKHERLKELYEILDVKYNGYIELHLYENQYSPGWYWLTIHDIKASKDQAVGILLDMLGTDTKSLTVFGDHSNDIKMFKIAQNRIAVGNAIDQLKEHATKIIDTNEEDSVVRFIIYREKAQSLYKTCK
jgi:5-amino-6-(5-phospho-D-ribitylamino)uracil phosphatase